MSVLANSLRKSKSSTSAGASTGSAIGISDWTGLLTLALLRHLGSSVRLLCLLRRLMGGFPLVGFPPRTGGGLLRLLQPLYPLFLGGRGGGLAG